MQNDCLLWEKPEKTYGSSILKVATQFGYVRHNTRVVEVAEALNRSPELMAVGVCDDQDKLLGMLTRVHLQGMLSKPFGREIMARKLVADLILKTEVYDLHSNLFQVAQELSQEMNRSTVSYFLLSDGEGRFKGVFSSKDILHYLSRMTQNDIEMAAQLQSRMVKPEESWTGETWAAKARCRTAMGVGGDFYFYKELGGGRHFFTLGDVSGKGVGASILTSLLWGILRAYDYRKGLSALLKELNHALIHTFHLEKYLTGVFMLWDERKENLKIADMGHGHLGVLRKDKFLNLKTSQLNLPLGIELEIEPSIYRFDIKAGDLVVAYTDGITEQENKAGQEFGEEELKKLIVNHKDGYDELSEEIWRRIDNWRGKMPQHDDMTWFHLELLKKN